MSKSNELFKFDETALIHSYQDAISKKEFKDYLYSLKVKDEILMNYTSLLQDAYEEYNNCNNCNNISSCKNKIKGYKYTPEVEGKIITFDYVACEKYEKELKDNNYKKNVSLYEMPKEIKDASFKNIYKDDKSRVPIIKYFKEFMSQYNNDIYTKGLYLHGSFGSGKTYLIASLFNEMAKKGVKSILIYYPDFLRSLKASFQTNYGEQFDEIKTIPLLLLDDIGAENCSNWSRDEILGPLLQYRMENHLPTFFTSNLTIEELEKSLSITTSGVDKVKARRIIERIKQLSIQQELISKNRRE